MLLIGGISLDKPIARYGRFVTNTKAEIYQAVFDSQNGKMYESNRHLKFFRRC
ncbi:MAG: pirin-like C-terminal cupin domain-containing protein [Nitrososphaeraceae archaeon]